MSKLATLFLMSVGTLVLVAALFGCPGKLAPTPAATNFISNSEVAEAVASGVVMSTYSNGTEARYKPKTPKAIALAKIVESYLALLPKAEAAVAQGQCPTIQTGSLGSFAPNSACTNSVNTAGQQVTALTWTPCYGAAPLGTWSGGVNLTLLTTPGNTAMNCLTGTFPPFQAGDVLWRTFLSPSGRINNMVTDPVTNIPWNPVTALDLIPPYSSGPVTVLVDTFGATQLPVGFNPTTTAIPTNYPPTGYSGYANQVATIGEVISFSGAIARTITVYGIHLKGSVAGYITWDFTVSSALGGAPVPLALDGANNLTGTLYVQDNIKQITTQSVFGGPVTFSAGCGIPMGGTVTTTLVSSNGNPFTPETLTGFGAIDCGFATLNGTQTYLYHAF